MMLLWTVSCLFYGIYTIAAELSIPLMIQPVLFGLLSLTCYTQSLYYDNPMFFRKKTKTIFIYINFCIIWAVIQTACVLEFGLLMKKYQMAKGSYWDNSFNIYFYRICTKIYEIIRKKVVRGISLIFLAVDFSGGIFSTLSLVFRPPPFDGFAAACYIVIFMMDLIIIVLYYYFNWLRKKSLISVQNIEQGDDHINEQVNIHIIELGNDHNIEQENDHGNEINFRDSFRNIEIYARWTDIAYSVISTHTGGSPIFCI
ncbi:PQ-loop-domain-containing protein [Gigaspora margarita]|uniref:PQ-loop-domain-containing protein n=1 Tax=Gigaspora margarita TaxID=4874 RepID=A0A8H4ATA2_GIGMA|nr:PQ-loop-domain-containing protein [Gigaspora margarita]